MSNKKDLVIVVSVGGGCMVMKREKAEELKRFMPKNSVRSRGLLWGVPVWTTMAAIAEGTLCFNNNGHRQELPRSTLRGAA